MPVLNHMDLVKIDDLETLLAKRDGPCISLFMPTERGGPEVRQNPIRLKNLIKQTAEQLKETGLSTAAQQELLTPLHQVQNDQAFWQVQSDGLVLFTAPDFFASYRLPLDLDELAVISHRFHVKPLLPMFSRDQRFFILALSMNQVRLFQATRHSLNEVSLEDIVVTNMSEALRLDDPEREAQFHTSTDVPASTGGRTPGAREAVFHGHSPEEDRKKDLLRFFHKIDDGITNLLDSEQVPLILVGVDYLLPLYQQANTYPHLVEDGITGNPDEFDPEDFHDPAWDIVKSRLDAARDEAAQRYSALIGQNAEASDDIEVVIPAAYFGRVDTLFVEGNAQTWGRFDPQANEVQLDHEPTTANEDLLDMAASKTILQGGSVYVVDPGKIPSDTSVAAIFRY